MQLESLLSSYDLRAEDGLAHLNEFLNPNQTTTDVTFWGTRVINRELYEGYMSIDAIAQMVIDAGFYKSPTFTDEERNIGITLVHKLRDYYNRSDQSAKEKNILTRIFLFLRDFFANRSSSGSMRYRTEDTGWAMNYFCGYSKEEFAEKFPVKEENTWGILCLVSEDDVRGLLTKA